MKRLFHVKLPKLLGRNLHSTPKEVIIDQMKEPRPLPMGRMEFEEWSERIIGGAMIPGSGDPEIFHDSQKFVLSDMITHLGPTESHKPDAHFIHSLRKFAVNQVAVAVREELRDKAKARTDAEKATKDEDNQG